MFASKTAIFVSRISAHDKIPGMAIILEHLIQFGGHGRLFIEGSSIDDTETDIVILAFSHKGFEGLTVLLVILP